MMCLKDLVNSLPAKKRGRGLGGMGTVELHVLE